MSQYVYMFNLTKKNIKPSRNHPFVKGLENELIKLGFNFGYIDIEDNRTIRYYGRIAEYGRSYIELLYQPDKTNSWFRIEAGIESPYLVDVYNGVGFWKCENGVEFRPINSPAKVIRQYLQVLCSTSSPPLGRLKWGQSQAPIIESVSEAIADIENFAMPFLNQFNCWETIVDYLVNRPNVPSNSVICSFRELLAITLIKYYLAEQDEALKYLQLWKQNEYATIERIFCGKADVLAESHACLNCQFGLIQSYINNESGSKIQPEILRARYKAMARGDIPYGLNDVELH